MVPEYRIPHPPECGQEEHPNSYPLTKGELIDLLDTALAWQDHAGPDRESQTERTMALARIQGRLVQAIPGMICPYPLDGELAETKNAVDRAYVDWIYHPQTLFLKEFVNLEDAEITQTLMQLLGIEDA